MATAMLVTTVAVAALTAAAEIKAAENAKKVADWKEDIANQNVRDKSYSDLQEILAQEGTTSGYKTNQLGQSGEKVAKDLYDIAFENNIEKHKQNQNIEIAIVNAVGSMAEAGMDYAGPGIKDKAPKPLAGQIPGFESKYAITGKISDMFSSDSLTRPSPSTSNILKRNFMHDSPKLNNFR